MRAPPVRMSASASFSTRLRASSIAPDRLGGLVSHRHARLTHQGWGVGVSFRLGSKSYFARKRVVDVGCGTGLVGICTALLGAHAILTDLCALPPRAPSPTSCHERALRCDDVVQV